MAVITIALVSALARRAARLDGKPQVSEHLDRTALPALEITGGEAVARGELVRGAQNCLRGVTAFLPHQVISRGGGEPVRSEKGARSQLVIIRDGPHHF